MKKIVIASTLLISLAISQNKDKSLLLLEETVNQLVIHIQELQNELDILKNKNNPIISSDISNNSSEEVIKNFTPGSIMVKTWKANARKKPLLDSKISKVYSAGQLLEIDETYSDNKWYRLKNGLYMAKIVAHLYDESNFILAITNKNTLLKSKPSNMDIDAIQGIKENEEIEIYRKKVADFWHISKESLFIRSKDINLK